MVQSHLEYTKKYIDDMKFQVRECNGKFLAAYASNASSESKAAFYEKEIDYNMMRFFKNQIDELIDSFDKKCKCIEWTKTKQ